MKKSTLLRDLDNMDLMLDQYFSDDRMVKAVATRASTGWYEKNNARLNDPEYRSKLKQSTKHHVEKLNSDPDILQKRKVATREFWNSNNGKSIRSQQQKKNWQLHRDSMQQALKDRYSDGTLSKKISESLKNSQACKENGKRNRKMIQTPDGIFDSRKSAAEFYGIHTTGINSRLKSKPSEYYYIEK